MVMAYALTFRKIGKIEADTAGLHLNVLAHTEPEGLRQASNRVPAFRSKALHSHFQASFTHLSACVRKQYPPPFRRTLPLRPAPRGRPRPRAPGAPGQEPARTLPARPDPPRAFSEFLREEPGRGGGAAPRSLLGHRRQGGCKMRDAFIAPNVPFLTRPATTKTMPLNLGNWDSRDNQEVKVWQE